MYVVVTEIRINVRTTADIKRDIEIAARLRGMTVSSLIDSLAVKAIREEKNYDPEAFARNKHEHNANEKRNIAPVVARIEPAVSPKDEIRKNYIEDGGVLKVGDQEKRKKTG